MGKNDILLLVSSALTLPSPTTSSSSSTIVSLASNLTRFLSLSLSNKKWPLTSLALPPHYFNVHHPLSRRVVKVGDKRMEVATSERTEADDLVDALDFGELCNEFEGISRPLVKSTARQLALDILELCQDNRAFNVYAVSVRYKDPVRSFTGRDIYKRPLWITIALENPSFRGLHATKEAAKDLLFLVNNSSTRTPPPTESFDVYSNPIGDPTKVIYVSTQDLECAGCG